MNVHTLLEINSIHERPGALPESVLLQESHMECQEYTIQTYDYQLMGPSGEVVV